MFGKHYHKKKLVFNAFKKKIFFLFINAQSLKKLEEPRIRLNLNSIKNKWQTMKQNFLQTTHLQYKKKESAFKTVIIWKNQFILYQDALKFIKNKNESFCSFNVTTFLQLLAFINLFCLSKSKYIFFSSYVLIKKYYGKVIESNSTQLRDLFI